MAWKWSSEDQISVLEVPGGWIYSHHTGVCFVPNPEKVTSSVSYQDAYQDGYEDGHQEGYDAAYKRIAEDDADAPDYTKAQEHLDNLQEILADVQKMYDPPRWLVIALANEKSFVATPELFISHDAAEKFAATLLTSYRIVEVITPFQEG